MRRSRHRKPPIAVTEFFVEQVRQLSPTCFQDEIASRLGCSQATVARVQKRHVIPHFDRHKRYSVFQV